MSGFLSYLELINQQDYRRIAKVSISLIAVKIHVCKKLNLLDFYFVSNHVNSPRLSFVSSRVAFYEFKRVEWSL